MATIVTRASKGSALTWTEGDANITNLNTDIANIVSGSTTVGAATTATNVSGTVALANGGTGQTTAPAAMAALIGFTTTATAGGTTTLTSSSTYYQVFTGSSNQTVQLPNTNTLATGWSYHIVNNTTASTLTVQSSSATSLGTIPAGVTMMVTVLSTVSNNATAFEVGYTDFSNLTGTGSVVLSTSPTLTTPTIGVATATSINKVAITAPATSATLTVADGKTLTVSNTLTFTGTDSSSVAFGTGGTVLYSGGALGTPSSGTVTNLTGTASININGTVGATTANTGSFTSLTSTGAMTFKQPVEAIYDNGNSGAATITPNAANGSVQKYTLTGNITWNAFGTPVAGQSMTMILVQDGTGGRTLTSTMKWAGGTKTLSTAASAIDIVTVYYDGTNYYASLAKGFA